MHLKSDTSKPANTSKLLHQRLQSLPLPTNEITHKSTAVYYTSHRHTTVFQNETSKISTFCMYFVSRCASALAKQSASASVRLSLWSSANFSSKYDSLTHKNPSETNQNRKNLHNTNLSAMHGRNDSTKQMFELKVTSARTC